MKPNNVIQISLHGRERNAKPDALADERARYAWHVRDYHAAGVAVPDAVAARCRQLGVAVERVCDP